MPNLHSARQGKKPQQQAWNELDRHRCDEELLAIESVGNRAGKQAEDYERKSLEKTCKSELEGRTGNFVYLIQTGDIPYLNRYRIENASPPDQAVIPNQQGRPRTNVARGRWQLYFG